MNIGKIEEAVKLLEQTGAVLTEEERQRIAWYAFKTGDDELTQKLVEELTEAGGGRESIFQKYFAVADREEAWLEQLEQMLVSLELMRLREKEALKQLTRILEAYTREITEKENVRKEETEKAEKTAEKNPVREKKM